MSSGRPPPPFIARPTSAFRASMSKCVRVDVRTNRRGRGARLIRDLVFGLERQAELAVEGDTISVCGIDMRAHSNRAVRGQHERPIRQRMRRDWREDQRVHRRMDDRPARREVVGRRSRRRRDDEAVGFEIR